MTEKFTNRTASAVALLELRDALDLLDEELRINRIAFVVTLLVSNLLAAPLLIVLFLNAVPLFAAYPSTFFVTLGAILCALTVERRRLEEERQAIRYRINQIEDSRLARSTAAC